MMANAAFLALGLCAGALYFSLLYWTTARHLQAGRLGLAVASQLARLAGLAAVLVLVATCGALPLLLTALGVLIARPLVTRLLAAAP